MKAHNSLRQLLWLVNFFRKLFKVKLDEKNKTVQQKTKVKFS